MVTFWVLAPFMVLAALGLLFVRKAVHAALCLAVVMIGLALLYAVQDAPFLFAVQIIVYTGAILMLFLFVLMVVGVDASDSIVETIRGQRLMARAARLAPRGRSASIGRTSRTCRRSCSQAALEVGALKAGANSAVASQRAASDSLVWAFILMGAMPTRIATTPAPAGIKVRFIFHWAQSPTRATAHSEPMATDFNPGARVRF